MKKQTLTAATVTVISLIVGALLLGSAAALLMGQRTVDTSRVYIEPSSLTVKKDTEVSVAVRINSKEPIDAVMANLSYDKHALTYKDIQYDKTAFDSNMPAIPKDGSVMLQAAKLGGKTVQGDVPVATVVFTGVRDGSTTVTLADANAAHAGVATKPAFKPVAIQPAVWWLAATALVLAGAAGVVGIRGKKS